MQVFRRGPLTVASNVGVEKIAIFTNISLYPENGTRYSHSYCRMRTGNGTKAFEWYRFE